MDVEFDTAKDAENRRKHGLPLAPGLFVLTALIAEIEDDRHAYGETRMIDFGSIAGRLHVCVYTLRGETRRIISVRKANRKEVRRWQL